MTEKPTKKTKGGQKLTWHQVITRDVNTINIDLKKAITLSQDRDLYNELVATVFDSTRTYFVLSPRYSFFCSNFWIISDY